MLRKIDIRAAGRRAAAVGTFLALSVVSGCVAPEPAPPPEVDFRNPPVIESKNGVLETELSIEYADNWIGSDRVRLRAYNGATVGPTLRLRPGELLKLHLVNRLPAMPGAHASHNGGEHDVNVPHGFNTTNLHTHGLHVSPSGISDNVFLTIEPGQDQRYEIALHESHPGGTFWYHPHKHGSVAIQVGSGMSGALLVEGRIDRAPELQGVAEKIFVFQQIPYALSEDGIGRLEDYDSFGPLGWERSGRFTTINGLVQPLLEARPGEVQRWRFIHAGLRETIMTRLVPCDADWRPREGAAPVIQHEIAVDGITRYSRADKAQVELQPGYRSDVMLRLVEPGNYCLMDAATNAGLSLFARPEATKLLAKVRVAGEPVSMPLPPADLTAYAPLAPIEADEITGKRSTEFNVVPQLGKGFAFQVNGKVFDPDVVDETLKLGAVEEWTLTSKFGGHPYHIHVNPFQIVEGAEPVWRDTIIVRSKQPVVMRTRYTRYTGKFVLHCHILDHEDRGMMQIIEVVP